MASKSVYTIATSLKTVGRWSLFLHQSTGCFRTPLVSSLEDLWSQLESLVNLVIWVWFPRLTFSFPLSCIYNIKHQLWHQGSTNKQCLLQIFKNIFHWIILQNLPGAPPLSRRGKLHWNTNYRFSGLVKDHPSAPYILPIPRTRSTEWMKHWAGCTRSITKNCCWII